MIVGLYDQDLANLGFCPPNLDLMKISSYYKRQRDIVSLTPSIAPHEFTEYYYVQDYPGQTNYSILGENNVHFGGKQLINDTLWLPDNIQKMPADPSIYRRFYAKLDSQYDRDLGERLLDMEHIRLSLDGKVVWKDYKSQFVDPVSFTGVMVHDEDITSVAGALSELKSMIERPAGTNNASIATKYPIRIHNRNQLEQWTRLRYAQHLNVFYVDYLLNGGDISRLNSRIVQYNITNSFKTENDFLVMGLAEVIRSVIKFQSLGNSVLLIYEPEKITTPTVQMLIDTLSNYVVGIHQKLPIGQFFTKYYPGDMRILIKLLNYWSPESFRLLKEN